VLALSTSVDDTSLRVTEDELTAYFSQYDAAGTTQADLFVATRTNTTTNFSNIRALAINSADPEEFASITRDQLELIFTLRPQGGSYNIYSSTRARTLDPFVTIVKIDSVSSTSGDIDPYVAPDGRTLYFSSGRDSSGSSIYHIYSATRSSVGVFDSPIAVSALGTTDDDRAPLISADGLALYFSSLRAPSAGERDMWVSHRATPTDSFGAPVPVSELNTATSEQPTGISGDGCTLYFTRRNTMRTDRDFLVATKPQ